MLRTLIFLLLIIFGSCSSGEGEHIIHKILSNWVQENPRVSKDYSCTISGGNLIIILKEQSKVSSPDMERVSSDNLIYKIIDSKYDLNAVDTISIYFDLPALQKTSDLEKQKVNKLYTFDKDQLETVRDFYIGNTIAQATSDYITFNVKNSEELELFQVMNLAKDFFKWKFEKFDGGISNIYEYSFLKSKATAKKEKLNLQLVALYKVGETANINSLHHLDSIFNIFGDINLNLKLHEIDSIGKHLDIIK